MGSKKPDKDKSLAELLADYKKYISDTTATGQNWRELLTSDAVWEADDYALHHKINDDNKSERNWARDRLIEAGQNFDLLFYFDKVIQDQIKSNDLDEGFRTILVSLAEFPDQHLITVAKKYFAFLADGVDYVTNKDRVNNDNLLRDGLVAIGESGRNPDDLSPDAIWKEYMRAFTKPGKAPYVPAFGFQDTEKRLVSEFEKNLRPNTPPQPINPWECRIGAAKFLVPPINIDVTQSFRVSSIGGGALRQSASPKFNSGHTETVINMTLYFPNQDSIWGYKGNGDFKPDFSKDGLSDEDADRFISSLRGLITEFKYAPFLPIKNDYLNRAHGITGVVMSGMTVSTLPDFPFCVVVNLEMLKFNHKAYLPMISDFDQAIDWGKFRQYIGAASQAMENVVSKGFLVEKDVDRPSTLTSSEQEALALADLVGGQAAIDSTTGKSVISNEYQEKYGYNKEQEYIDGQNFDLYYPTNDPQQVFAPDMSDFRSDGEDSTAADRSHNMFEDFLGHLGITVDTNWRNAYANLAQNSKLTPPSRDFSPLKIVAEWVKQTNAAIDALNPAKFNQFIKDYFDGLKKNGQTITDDQKNEITESFRQAWLSFLLNNYKNSPYFQTYFQSAQFRNGKYLIHEWEVPMSKAVLDWDHMKINGVTVSLANNIARQQIQMLDEPVHQHVGAHDATVNVSLTVLGENNLIRLRQIFEHTNNLARLEHAHGALGFLGIKNVLTGLCGIKYALPLSCDIKTVDGYPHVYNVNLSLVDFDVFQQKREMLSSDQQKELIDAFGKRNPFLRIKQLWGMFNAYPDFPLGVKDKDGKIVGHLDPDYYFRSFQTIEDDIVNGVGQKSDTDVALTKALHQEIGDPPTKPAADASADDISQYNKSKQEYEEKVSQYLLSGAPYPTDTSHFLFDYYQSDAAESFKKIAPDYTHTHTTYFGQFGDDENSMQAIAHTEEGLTFGSVSSDTPGSIKPVISGALLMDDNPVTTLQNPFVSPDLTPFAKYSPTYADGSANPNKQFQLMMRDTQYRDVSGRMIRAFPTYMLWLIDEGGNFAGVKLFDDFYGLQSIVDFSVVSSEDILGDTLVLRVSNLYSKLTTRYRDYLDPTTDNNPDPNSDTNVGIPDLLLNTQRNLQRGTDAKYLFSIENIRLKPGVRVHLRMGYSANPNSLQTVFNGVITQVEQGDVVTITAQSDAIELSPMVNTANKKGDTTGFDGALNTGFWLSEPRDLMVRLLSMGSSSFKESFAAASNGMIFSENSFGIRHFGQILYEPLSDAESVLHEKRYQIIKSAVDDMVNAKDVTTGIDDFIRSNLSVRGPVITLMRTMWVNEFRKRDYELFKRNIYPGNGLGVAQFLGGDLGDGGLALAAAGQASNADEIRAAETDIKAANNDALRNDINVETDKTPGGDIPGGYKVRSGNPLLQFFKLAGYDDDLPGFDEVSFRAQTYMKSVWDLFQECAALLPNYIVAVRPFEQRSTVFYGKPHWMYTSGVIPVSTGIPVGSEPGFEATDKALEALINLAAETANPLADLEKQQKLESFISSVSPASSVSGVPWKSSDVQALPLSRTINGKDIQLIPARTGKVVEEMHIPTSLTRGAAPSKDDLTSVPPKHIQVDGLPDNKKYPYYMDRIGGPQGGVNSGGASKDVNTGTVLGEDPNTPGSGTAFSHDLTPEEEQWYLDMRWPQSNGNYPNDWAHKKILVYNDVTQKACVCTPGDWGPAENTGFIAGLSPDVMHVLDSKTGDDRHWFGLVPDDTKLGPINDDASKFLPKNTTVQVRSDTDPKITGSAGFDPKLLDQVQDKVSKNWLLEKIGQINKDASTRPENLAANLIAEEANYGATSSSDKKRERGGSDITPVWIDPQSGLYVSSKYQNVGDAARTLYDKDYAASHGGNKLLGGSDGRSLADAESIWDDFRNGFQDFDAVKSTYEKITGRKVKESGKQTAKYLEFIDDFKRFLWTDPFHRAWLVTTTDRKVKLTKVNVDPSRILNDTLNTNVALNALKHVLPLDIPDIGSLTLDADPSNLLSNLTGGASSDLVSTVGDALSGNISDIPGDVAGGVKDVVTGGVGKAAGAASDLLHGDVGGALTHLNPFGSSGNTFEGTSKWDFGSAKSLWTQYVTERNNRDPEQKLQALDTIGKSTLDKWVHANLDPGSDQDTGLGKAAEEVKNLWDDTLGQLFSAVGAGISGLISVFRISLMQLGQGLSMVGTMQKQANLLNKVFNDSIYYAAGPPGGLLRLMDNPFTREYGEPVIEIREPFQRLHYIDSFQHILNNGVTENLEEVATVVTATSDGNYPVKVYFDKGMPSQFQKEISVETGLYWDNVRGSGITGFLQPLFHPIEVLRGSSKLVQGSSDELMSRRVGLYHLKESLKDIYKGEIIITGNADIRAHDLIYIADVYERMYGMVEVEQVVHHFTPDLGFITSITPNAVVTINDPARWSMITWIWSWFNVKHLRDFMRQRMDITADSTPTKLSTEGLTTRELAESLAVPIKGHLQYTQGSAGLVKDLAASSSMGLLRSAQHAADGVEGAAGKVATIGALSLSIPFGPIAGGLIGDLLWDGWKWVRDNLLDQHGCYIQYLNKDGLAMDAGLSYAQGVAVGRTHSLTLLPSLFGITVNIEDNGHKRITEDDMLASLGWDETSISAQIKNLSWWENQTNSKILAAAGKGPDQLVFTPPTVFLAQVPGNGVIDGDTFLISAFDVNGVGVKGTQSIRFAGINAPELAEKDNRTDTRLNEAASIANSARARLAAEYVKEVLDTIRNKFGVATVAIRINNDNPTDTNRSDPNGGSRIVGTIFAYVPPGFDTDADTRNKKLFEIASQWPLIEWDSYMEDGTAYTLNWDLVVHGLADVDLVTVAFNDPNRGATNQQHNGG